VKFKAAGEAMQKNEELNKLAKYMQRSFCVIVLETSYSPKT